MMLWLAVGAGGAFGAMSRYALASAFGVQRLGNEARLPRTSDVFATAEALGDPLPQP